MIKDTPAAEPEIRLSSLETHVLLVLAEHDLHGYGIAKAIERREGPRIFPANLYRHLKSMAARGLIQPQPPTLDESGRARRQFHITNLGQAAVRQEGQRLRRLLTEFEMKNLLPAKPPAK